MRTQEIKERTRQEIQKRLDELTCLVGLPQRKPARSGSAAPSPFFSTPQQIDAIVRTIQSRLPQEAQDLIRRADRICERRFDLLGYRDLDFGKEIDWSLDPVTGRRAPNLPWRRTPYLDYDKVGDHKVTWELGRHQHLALLARAWRLTGNTRYLYEAIDQFRDWRKKNPYPRGIHWTSALEVAFRALSWLWMIELIDGNDQRQQEWRNEAVDAAGHAALYLERFLSTYFSPNTHLLGEALALYAIGTVCTGFRDAVRWRDLGREILLREADRQILPDGAYFEQSTYYHVYALDMFLHFSILAGAHKDALPDSFRRTVERMAEWLWRLSAGGAPARFGDDDGGRLFDPARNRQEHLLDPLSTAAVWLNRPEFKAACGGLREETVWLLGPDAGRRFDSLPNGAARPQTTRHEGSGFHVLVSAEEPPGAVVFDVGPLGALSGGHGHADALSLQWIRGKRVILLDPGTGRYPDGAPERNQLRGTAAHSTVCVGETNQAEPRGSFGWESLPASHTNEWVAGSALDLIAGSHEGYQRLSPAATHRRWVVFFRHGRLFVRDRIETKGPQSVAVCWRVGPDFAIAGLNADAVDLAAEDGARLQILAPRRPEWSREIFADDWSPCYGRLEAAPTVRFHSSVASSAEWATALVYQAKGEPYPQDASVALVCDGKGRELTAYLDRRGESEALLCFADDAKAWKIGPLESDARFLAVETGPGEPRLFAAGIRKLSWGGRNLLDGGVEAFEKLEWSPSLGLSVSGKVKDAARMERTLQSMDWAELTNSARISC